MAKHSDPFMHTTLTYLGMPTAASHNAWTPNTDVYETADALIVRMELAGIKQEDLEITLNDRLLLVRGQRRDPCRQGRCSFRQMEIDYGYFERRIVIPRAVAASGIRAHFHNGFLQIQLPKGVPAAPTSLTIIIEPID